MPKIKTHNSTAKRITITKGGKLKIRKAGQNHFNARENGTTGRNKKRDISAPMEHAKTIKSLMPYNN